MNARALVVSAVACAALVAGAAWWFELSFERAALLAPVIVLCFGAAVGLALLWTKVVLDSLRRRRE